MTTSILRFSLVPVLFFLVACGPPPGGPRAALEGSATASTAAAATVTVAPPVTSVPRARSPRMLELEQTIAADVDSTHRREAIDAYADELSETEELLRTLGADPDPVVRRWAALALTRRARADDAPAIEQAAASEPDPAVRHILQRAVERARRS